MQSVSNTVKNLVNALEPVRLSLNVSGESALGAAIVSCTVQARCGGADYFSIGSACSGSASLVLDSAVALGLKDKLVELKWKVRTSTYSLFTGYCTRERVENGALSVELNDAIYVYGSLPYEPDYNATDAKAILNSVRAQLGQTPLETATGNAASGLAIDLANLPEGSTLADTLALVSACMGGNAVINRQGQLSVRTFQSVDFSSPCYDGSDAKDANAYAVTGLTFIRRDTDADGVETETEYSAGDGALKLENNLATQALADHAYAKISGLSVYAGTFSIPGGLLLEPGDIIRITNGGESFHAACMDLTMEIDGGVKTTISSYGEAETGGASGSLNRKIDNALNGVSDVRDQVLRERTAREEAVEGLNKTLADASGLYLTAEEQSDGSTIYYFHDKKTLAESQFVIKFSADAIGVSNDGGKTYEYGFTANGDAILNLIYAKGINADYIDAGTISGIKIIGTEGTIGGLTMTDKTLSATYRYDYPEFTQDDVSELRKLILSDPEWTPEQLQMYDLNLDGEINIGDVAAMTKMVNDGGPFYSVYRLSIDTTNPSAGVKLEVTEGWRAGWSTVLGMGTVRTRDLIADSSLTVNGAAYLNGVRLYPDMELGVEYETAEKWLGKAVYTKILDCGTASDGMTVDTGVLLTDTLLRYSGIVGGYPTPQIYDTLTNNYSAWFCVAFGSSDYFLRLKCGSGLAGKQAYAQIWYVKAS